MQVTFKVIFSLTIFHSFKLVSTPRKGAINSFGKRFHYFSVGVVNFISSASLFFFWNVSLLSQLQYFSIHQSEVLEKKRKSIHFIMCRYIFTNLVRFLKVKVTAFSQSNCFNSNNDWFSSCNWTIPSFLLIPVLSFVSIAILILDNRTLINSNWLRLLMIDLPQLIQCFVFSNVLH